MKTRNAVRVIREFFDDTCEPYVLDWNAKRKREGEVTFKVGAKHMPLMNHLKRACNENKWYLDDEGIL